MLNPFCIFFLRSLGRLPYIEQGDVEDEGRVGLDDASRACTIAEVVGDDELSL